MRFTRIVLAIAVSGIAALSVAQTAQKPQFEVASIKRELSRIERGGGFERGGHFRMTYMDVRTLIRTAYRSGPVLFPSQIVGGPDWIDSERYDVEANVSSEMAAKTRGELDQLEPLLLQSLLEERLKVRVHHETRNMPRYALVVARKDATLGPGLRPSSADCSADFSKCATIARPGIFTSGAAPISYLSNYIGTSVMNEVVVDRTGLEGRFEIHLEWSPEQLTAVAGAAPTNGAPLPADKPSIFTALQEQLGLRLIAERGPVDVIIIDHVERPTDN